jgi:hypothetical protein
MDLHASRDEAAALVAATLTNNPYTTLQVVLEPTGSLRGITPQLVERLARACFQHPTYLDKFYAVLPGRPKGAKRLIVVLPVEQRSAIDLAWIESLGQFVTLVWRGEAGETATLDSHELVIA